MIIGLLLFVVATALWIYASYWVYNDANRRGSDHALAWGIGVFLIGLIGLVLYFVVRSDVGDPEVHPTERTDRSPATIGRR